jgi:Activator of Hsp90 ATPase homolog 1-like protein
MPNSTYIIASVIIDASLEKVWTCWTKSEHIIHWSIVAESFQIIKVSNNVEVFGQLKISLQAEDGSLAQDEISTYAIVEKYKKLKYMNASGKTVTIDFIEKLNIQDKNKKCIQIIQSIQASPSNEMITIQLAYQTILNKFKVYTEGIH